METLPTSPAKHFALVRKLNKQNTNTLNRVTIIKLLSVYSPCIFKSNNGINTANE